MSGKSPGRRIIKTCRRECIKAQGLAPCMDVICNLLQTCEILDVLNLVAGLLKKRLVCDESEGLVAVTQGDGLAIITLLVVDVRRLLLDQVRSEEHTSELQSRQYLVCR